MTWRLSSRSWRASSRSARAPKRTKPPSRRRWGRSSTRQALRASLRVGGTPVSALRMAVRSLGRPMGWACWWSVWAQALAASRPSRMQPKSRGPPRPKAKRVTPRAMSGAWRRLVRSQSRVRSSLARKATQSRRALMARASASGDAMRPASSREPAPVTVRSMAPSRLLVRSPDAVRTSSRLDLVAASMTRIAPAPVIFGGRTTGVRPIWVRSTYLSSAPIAESWAREKVPMPARSETPRRAFKRCSPDRLSKEAEGAGVAAAPESSIQRRRGLSEKGPSVRIISLGERRISSPGRSQPASSPTSNSPVEMSREARATVASGAVGCKDAEPGATKSAVR